ncbi:MAG: HD domain-containing protein [Pseudomonadales bacterium]
MAGKPNFTAMEQSTAEDWQRIYAEQANMFSQLPGRIIDHLHMLQGDCGGFPIDRFEHCLQTATLAHEGGEDEEYVVCALLHDIGDTLGSLNHADVAATILQPFVTEENYWMVKHHGIFQGYYFFHHIGLDRNMRDQFKEHPVYERTEKFVANYDNPAFNPEKTNLPIDFFEPMVQRVLSIPRRSLYPTEPI